VKIAALLGLGLVVLAHPARARAQTDAPVLLVAPPAGRLASQIRRELAASGFSLVESAALPPAGLPPEVRAAVVVAEPDGRVRVFLAGRTLEPLLRADLTVDRADPHAGRRVGLAVVEYLRLGPPAEPAADAAPGRAVPLAAAAVVMPLEGADPPDSAGPWAIGFATTLNLDSGVGEPTSHVQLMGQLPLGERWALWVGGLWPVLGAQFQTEAQVVRMWTVGGSVGLRLRLPTPTDRLRPFLGIAAGARFVLSDSDDLLSRQSRVVFTPSLTLGGTAGLLWRIRPLVHLVCEVHAAFLRMVPLGVRTGYEMAAARGRAAHAAVGILFEY
jgi:hypothetical protein